MLALKERPSKFPAMQIRMTMAEEVMLLKDYLFSLKPKDSHSVCVRKIQRNRLIVCPLSNNTLSPKIEDTAVSVGNILINRTTNSNCPALHLGEMTGITDESNIHAYIRCELKRIIIIIIIVIIIIMALQPFVLALAAF
jgi:hypothetical protein